MPVQIVIALRKIDFPFGKTYLRLVAKSSPLSHLRFPLDHILGNVGNVRVLRALIAFGGPLSVSRLAADTRLTPQGVRLVLDSLVSHGVVQVLGQGRSQLYLQAPAHPWTPALQELFGAEQHIWTDLLDKVQALLGGLPDVAAAWLYGSVARGDDRPQSDVDVAVLLQPGGDEDRLRSAFESLQEALHVTFSIVAVTQDDLRKGTAAAPWWNNVRADGIQLKGEVPFSAP